MATEKREWAVAENAYVIDKKEVDELFPRMSSFENKIWSLKERFYRFVKHNNPTGASYNLIPSETTVPVECYDLEIDFDNAENGVYFYCEKDVSGSRLVFMEIPYEYLADPAGWETRALEAKKATQET